jgi:broad specificity phosphatase PhoE
MIEKKFQTIVFLVRHGQPTTVSNPRNPVIDGPRTLTPVGVKQAEAVGRYLGDFGPSAIYSSPVERCLETAQYINSGGQLKLSIIKKPGLREIYPSDSESEVGERSETIIDQLAIQHAGQHIICVSHQFVIGHIVAVLEGKKSWQNVPCDWADVYRLVFAGDKLVEATRLQPAADV